MEINEGLLDEENEKILSKLDNAIGLSKSKEVLRNIIKYNKVLKNYDCNIEFENYNIVIRNESSYTFYEELISVIAEVYYKNGIISNLNILYFDPEEIRYDIKNKKKINNEDIKEGIIVIDLDAIGRTLKGLKKEIKKMIEKMPQKAFIILEYEFVEGEVNAVLTEYFSWSMKIEKISNEEKSVYIRKFMDLNNLTYNDKVISELSNNPYYIY